MNSNRQNFLTSFDALRCVLSLSAYAFFSLLLFVFFCTATARGQDPPNNLHQWGSISSFHGLPSDRVTSIAQTGDGILWFGTDKGLAHYDGRRVRAVSAENLANLKIFSLKTDGRSVLWIGTEKGAFRFENGRYSSIPETAGQAVNSILAAGDVIFVSTNGGAIFRLTKNPDNSVLAENILPAEFPITGLARHGDNLIASTLSRGLLLIEKDTAREITTTPRPYFVNLLAKDENGQLWLGAQTRGLESGLYFSPDLFRPQRIGDGLGTVTAIAFGAGDSVWAGTQRSGAYLFRGSTQSDRFTFENTAGGLRSNEILSVFVDRENVVWFGTNKGVSRFDLQSPKNEPVGDNAQSNFVRTVYRTKSGILLVGTNRGLFYKDPDGRLSVVNGLENNPVFSVAETPAGEIAVGAMGGYYPNVRPDSVQNAPLKLPEIFSLDRSESVRAIENFQGRTFLAFYNRGLLRIDGEELLSNVSTGLQNPISLHAARNLWIGTSEDGVYFFDGEKLRSENALESLKKNAVWAIDGDEDSGLWFAAERGLFFYMDGRLQSLLTDVSVRDVRVIKDRKLIYAATADGLVQFVFDENLGWITSRLGVEQGLPSSNIFSVVPAGDNSVIAATNRGVSSFSVNGIKPLLVPVRILSRRLHQTEELIDGINLDYPQNSLALEVAALSSRTFPEQFQYVFYLRDSKGELLNSKFSNDAQFLMENLAPGKYAVEAAAFDKNLVRSEPFTFEFTVGDSPFPWTSFFLSVLLVFALVALIWAVVSQRKIFQKSFELAHANRELNSARLDLANEAERERRRISRDLHDQTLADLRHLILLTDKFPIASGMPDVFRTEIENVSQEIRRICEDLSPSVLENIGFTAALEWALINETEFIDDEKKYGYRFICEENLEDKLKFTPAVQIQIYRIVQEVLSNITRHGRAANVEMALRIAGENLFIMTIRDDGVGFDSARQKAEKGRGLSNIRARAELIKASVSWDRIDESGMIFELRKKF